MRAAFVPEPGKIDCVEAPIPPATAGKVLVRTLCASLCGSDLHEVFLPLSYWTFPCPHGFPGHEAVGEVVESAVEGFRPGQRVLACPDRTCSAGFADFQVLDPQFLLPMPSAPAPDVLAIAQPLGTVIWGLKAFMPGEVPETAVVLGQGSIGIFFTWMLKRRGVKRVITSDLDPGRRALSKRYGADVAVDAVKDSVVEAVNDLTNGQGVPLVIEAAGTDETRFQAIHAVARDGTIGLFGLPFRETIDNFPFNEFYRKRATMRSTFGSQREPNHASYRTAVELIASGAIDVKPLITHRFPIEDIGRAFKTAHHREDNVLKVSITFGR